MEFGRTGASDQQRGTALAERETLRTSRKRVGQRAEVRLVADQRNDASGAVLTSQLPRDLACRMPGRQRLEQVCARTGGQSVREQVGCLDRKSVV